MLNVTEYTKDEYRATSSDKKIYIYFPDDDYYVPDASIVEESMSLIESLSESDVIEFVGCISSQFKITLYDILTDIKGKRIEVTIQSGSSEVIPLFKGVITDVAMQSNRNYKEVTAYDDLQVLSTLDVSAWYQNLAFPMTLAQFRNEFFNHIGITQETVTLPCDSILVNQVYLKGDINALYIAKSICQINAVFGIINRNGNFAYRTLPKTAQAIPQEIVGFQRSIDYKEYTVKPVDKLVIKPTDNDEGVSYGDGDNVYTIVNNMFTINMDYSTLSTIAQSVYDNVSGFYYHPVDTLNNGLPWMEVGDIARFSMYDFEASAHTQYPVYKWADYYILSREMNGIVALKDSYIAKGEEYQREFTTDLGVQVDDLRREIDEISSTVSSMDMTSVKNGNNVTLAENTESTILTYNFEATNEVNDVLMDISVMTYTEATETEASDIYTIGDIKATFKVIVDDYYTVETKTGVVIEGNDIINLNCAMQNLTQGAHKLDVTMTLTDGSGTIYTNRAQELLWGRGITFQAYVKELNVVSHTRCFYIGQELTYDDAVIEKVYNNGLRGVVTRNCTYRPAIGTELTDVGELTVRVSYEDAESGKTFTTEYLTYVSDEVFEVLAPSPTVYGNEALNRNIAMYAGQFGNMLCGIDIMRTTESNNPIRLYFYQLTDGNTLPQMLYYYSESGEVRTSTFRALRLGENDFLWTHGDTYMYFSIFNGEPNTSDTMYRHAKMSEELEHISMSRSLRHDFLGVKSCDWNGDVTVSNLIQNCYSGALFFDHYQSSVTERYINPSTQQYETIATNVDETKIMTIGNYVIWPRVHGTYSFQETEGGTSITQPTDEVYGFVYATLLIDEDEPDEIYNNKLDLHYVVDLFDSHNMQAIYDRTLCDDALSNSSYNNGRGLGKGNAKYTYIIANGNIKFYALAFSPSTYLTESIIDIFPTTLSTISKTGRITGTNLYYLIDETNMKMGLFNADYSTYDEYEWTSTSDPVYETTITHITDMAYLESQECFFYAYSEDNSGESTHYLAFSNNLEDWTVVDGNLNSTVSTEFFINSNQIAPWTDSTGDYLITNGYRLNNTKVYRMPTTVHIFVDVNKLEGLI